MKSTPLLQLSGEAGGGQILRSALALSMITGRRFRITKIRGKRPKPGLMRQHLTCVKAAAEVCDAAVDGAELGSQELVFAPGKVAAGDYAFAIGSGGSTSLVLQTLLPALLQADGPSTVRIEGGTHNPLAPPFEFLAECFLPVLKTMGATVELTLERPGFMLAGGGVLHAAITPVKKWKTLKLRERGALLEGGLQGRIVHAHLERAIGEREIATLVPMLEWDRSQFEWVDANSSLGPGNAVLLRAAYEQVTEICSAVAQQGRSAEKVAGAVAKGMKAYLANEAPVGVHLADQLLLPMALAGKGEFHTFAISEHARTNMAVIEAFLEVSFEVTELERGEKRVKVRGR
ncbi:MAG: RNA 3'-terminal phosphate cyclase [Verrucomicrobiales bacterium]|nr:RNA 3'-terminal phosphate cyclase [Verrucomicrobiales bacterium]